MNYAATFDLGLDSVHDSVERVDIHTLTHQEFIRRYEKPLKPVVLTGAMDNWPAMKKWTIEVSNIYHIVIYIYMPHIVIEIGCLMKA